MPTKTFGFQCDYCKKTHKGSPQKNFESPFYFHSLSDMRLEKIIEKNGDYCTIRDEHFIRACLEIPIQGFSEFFTWVVWVSLSPESFRKYIETPYKTAQNSPYFGWFANRLPCYPDTLNLKVRIHLRSAGHRPSIELELSDHPLCRDYHEGIVFEKAVEIAKIVKHGEILATV
jgi:hypothetical protein